jgi:hypothetical protein
VFVGNTGSEAEKRTAIALLILFGIIWAIGLLGAALVRRRPTIGGTVMLLASLMGGSLFFYGGLLGSPILFTAGIMGVVAGFKNHIHPQTLRFAH